MEKKKHSAQWQNGSSLWHEVEQLLTNEVQHYTTVNDSKRRILQHQLAMVGEIQRNRI